MTLQKSEDTLQKSFNITRRGNNRSFIFQLIRAANLQKIQNAISSILSNEKNLEVPMPSRESILEECPESEFGIPDYTLKDKGLSTIGEINIVLGDKGNFKGKGKI